MDDLDAYLDHFAQRLIRDAFNEATAAYWLRRAEQFEAARPKPGDYFGQATREEVRAQYDRLTMTAHACRARAESHHSRAWGEVA